MKRKPQVLVFLFFSFFFLQAQEYTIGIKGGVNYSTIGELYHLGKASGSGINANPTVDTYFTADKIKEISTDFF